MEEVEATYPFEHLAHGSSYVSGHIFHHIYSSFKNYQKQTLGQFLTIIDASIADPEQRKATKDLTKKMFYSYTDEPLGLKYMTCTLSRFLRKFKKTGSEEEQKQYDEYHQINLFNNFGNHFVDDLEQKELG